jgi:hypothetical protein
MTADQPRPPKPRSRRCGMPVKSWGMMCGRCWRWPAHHLVPPKCRSDGTTAEARAEREAEVGAGVAGALLGEGLIKGGP